jgi:digeranylgeranylglycerophospholipid reductase
MIYNAIIIGAGPAGLIAGKNLGKDFLILEKKSEIGKPVQCVGMSVNSLKRQNLSEKGSYIKSVIHKVERIMPNGKKIGERKNKELGYVVERKSFEIYLSQEINSCIKTNANVTSISRNDNFWEVTTETGEKYKAKFIIGADGVNSIVRKMVFPESEENIELAFGLEYDVEFPNKVNSQSVKFYLDNNLYGKGYGWVFPTSENSANIGVGSENKNIDFNQLIEKLIKKESLEYNIRSKESGFTGSLNKTFPLFRDNAFLVGDAAGLNDPIFRAGTNQAMISGKIAAQCIKNNQEKKYNQMIQCLPFFDLKIKKAADIFYSFNNEFLENLGEILESKGFSSIKNPAVFLKLIKKKETRKNFLKILYFIKVWNKSKEWLW